MEDKELLQKIKRLEKIKPDDQWKNSYREILFSQISGGKNFINEKENKESLFSWKIFFGDLLPRSFRVELIKPVWIVVIVLAIVLSCSLTGVYASRDAKPGDSLYIAKIISEKAQLAITFSDQAKVKLGLEFATNRAKEITQVLDEPSANQRDKNERVKQLTADFKKEIGQVKDRLVKINNQAANSGNNPPAGAEEDQVFGANLGRSDQRMEISDSGAETEQATTSDRQDVIASAPEPAAASSTSGAGGNSEDTEEKTADKILDEAEKLFDDQNYDGTINKLKEADSAIDLSGADSGQVRGASEETATTTNN